MAMIAAAVACQNERSKLGESATRAGTAHDGLQFIRYQAWSAGRISANSFASFTGSFDDVGAAKEAALAEISQGADMLLS